MNKVYLIVIYITAILSIGTATSFAQGMTTLRCEGRLVSLGDDRNKVQEVCGPPNFIDDFHIQKTFRKYQKIHNQGASQEPTSAQEQPDDLQKNYQLISEEDESIDVEEWTYNWGSSRFIQTLRFENNRLCSIETGGYGFDKETNNAPHVQIGDSKAIVMLKYGKPTDIYKRPRTVSSMKNRHKGSYLNVEIIKSPDDQEEWLYDFGPNKFKQKLIFKNNRLEKIEQLSDLGTKK